MVPVAWSLLTLLMVGSVSPNIDWQSHLVTGDGDGSWGKDNNLTECFGSCLCVGAQADCSHRGLGSLPYLPEENLIIQTLDLTGNKIQDVSIDAVKKFPHLTTLILKANLLVKFPSAVNLLKKLTNLQLGGNNITTLASVQLPSTLTNLCLEKNNIENLPPKIFKNLSNLSILNLAYNHLTSMTEDSLDGLAKLQILILEGNRLEEIPSVVFSGLQSLAILELNNNLLKEVPTSISSLRSLERITLAKNSIETIPSGIFTNLRFLKQIELRGNPIQYYHPDAFVNLPVLNKLQMLGSPRVTNSFPNLTGSPSLELIHLDRLNLATLPGDLCSVAPKLHTLRLRSNKLKLLPILANCTELVQLDLGLNFITEVAGAPFKTLTKLQDLLLDRNEISHLSDDSFHGLLNLQILDLEKNNITEIHEDAFVPLNNLKDLNVGRNHFSVLPHQGLKTIIELKAHNNPKLKEFPKAESFPHIRVVRPSYAYHCCLFMPSTYENDHIQAADYADFGDLSENVFFPEEFDISQFGNQSLPSVIWSNSGNMSSQLGRELSLDLWENFGMSAYPDMSDLGEYDPNSISFFKPPEGIDCYPAPGPFLPCNDLFDWWTLRCGVWVVFLLALLGNGCVVFVLSFSRNKMDVPRFLVCNLAAADFFMGLYLGFLAVLDASTLGEFRKHAIAWQLSISCEFAGFFGVLSSELSVFTLAVITLERNYAITHAMHLNKRLSLKHAAYIMGAAWAFSIIMAALPLFGVSDYRKFAVCLPFETEDAISKGYVIFLMVINGVAFFILMGCYLKMYCAIRGSQAWNSNDSKIAKRMALLVFTDFICWFPIAFFAVTAACGVQLISLEGAKVFTVFVLPLNSCCNPFLYAILTKQFKKDCVMICKTIEESRVTRGIGRCRHSSNFSNRQTPANTNSLNSGSGSGSHTKNSVHCNCNVKKVKKISPRWPLDKIKSLLCGYKDVDEFNSQNEWNYQIAEIQQKQQKTKRQQSLTSSDNFSSSRSDSIKHGHCMPLRFVVNHPRRRNSWTVTRKTSQDSNLSSSRNDSAASNSTQSTNTWRMSHSSVSSDLSNSIGRTGSGYSDRSANGGKFDALARAQALHRQGSRPGGAVASTSPLAGGLTSIIKQNSSAQLLAKGGKGHTYMVRGKPRLIRQVAIQVGPSDQPRPASTPALCQDPDQAGGLVTKQVSFKETVEAAGCPVHHPAEAGSQGPGLGERFRSLYAKLTEASHEDEDAPQETPGQEEAEQEAAAVATAAPVVTLVTESGVTVRSPQLEAGERRDRRVSLGTLAQAQPDTLHTKHGSSLTNLKGLGAPPVYGPGRCTSENALLALQSKFGYSFKSAVTGSGHTGQQGVMHSRSENVLTEADAPEAESLLGSARRCPSPRSPDTDTSAPGGHCRDQERGRGTPTIEEEPAESDKLL